MRLYDLCLTWNWEYDAGFAGTLRAACAAHGATCLEVSEDNLSDILADLAQHRIGFRLFLDRASEADADYLPLATWAQVLGAHRLNPREQADRIYDKAALHHLFLANGIPTPHTLILPPYCDHPELASLPSPIFRPPYTVKPAIGGGGEGVVLNVIVAEQVQAARQQFPQEQYLIQEQIAPRTLDGQPAWFRAIYCLGEIFLCFWHPASHRYTPVSPQAEAKYGLSALRQLMQQIAGLCRLHVFSTEIALPQDERPFVVVDYVNDPIDLRLQSQAEDGVPDWIVERIAELIVSEAKKPSFLSGLGLEGDSKLSFKNSPYAAS